MAPASLEDVLSTSPKKKVQRLHTVLHSIEQSLGDAHLTDTQAIAYYREIRKIAENTLTERGIAPIDGPKSPKEGRGRSPDADDGITMSCGEDNIQKDDGAAPITAGNADMERVQEKQFERKGDEVVHYSNLIDEATAQQDTRHQEQREDEHIEDQEDAREEEAPDDEDDDTLETLALRAANARAHPHQKATVYQEAYRAVGWTQGDGIRKSSPIICGGHFLSQCPQPREIQLAINETTDVEEVRNIRQKVRVLLYNLRFLFEKNRQQRYGRLHPWAIEAWIKLFFHDCIGEEAIKKVNNILASISSTDDIKDVSYARARTLAESENVTPLVAGYFSSVAIVIRSQQKANSYAYFTAAYEGVVLVRKFNGLVQKVKMNPSCDDAREIDRVCGTVRKGRDPDVSRVYRYLDSLMRWDKDSMKQYIHKWQPLLAMCEVFSTGFLLLLDKSIHTTLKNNTYGSVPDVVRIIHETFPEFIQFCQFLNEAIVLPLLEGNVQILRIMARQKLSNSQKGLSVQERVDAAIQQAKSKVSFGEASSKGSAK